MSTFWLFLRIMVALILVYGLFSWARMDLRRWGHDREAVREFGSLPIGRKTLVMLPYMVGMLLIVLDLHFTPAAILTIVGLSLFGLK